MQETFKNRVFKFWNMFIDEEPQIREMIDNNAESNVLMSFLESILKVAFHEVFFEVGKSQVDGKYELILTPEGDRSRLLQYNYWLEQSPGILHNQWNFYACKPGKAVGNSVVEMFDTRLTVNDVLLYPDVDNDQNKLDIHLFSPKFESLNENQKNALLFVFLDEFVGEFYAMQYIGYIHFLDNPIDKHTVGIENLKEFIEDVIQDNGWEQFDNPCNIYTGYKMNPEKTSDWKLREDVVSGYSSCTQVVNAYYNKSEIFEGLNNDGVHYGFVFYENVHVPDEKIVTLRCEIENKIMKLASNQKVAFCIGAATGFHFSYLDFIIYDLNSFLSISKDVLSTYEFEETGFANFSVDEPPMFFNL